MKHGTKKTLQAVCSDLDPEPMPFEPDTLIEDKMSEITTTRILSLNALTASFRKSSPEAFTIKADRFFLRDQADNNDFEEFCQALEENTSVTKLTIDVPEAPSAKFLRVVSESLGHLKHVNSLTVQASTITGAIFVLARAGQACHIQSLKLKFSFGYHNFQSYHDHEIEALCNWLLKTFAITGSLVQFELEGYRVHSHRTLFQALASFPTLERVSLSGMVAYLDGRREPESECEALSLALLLPNLRELNLSGLVFATCHCETFARVLEQSHIQDLSFLNCKFDIDGARQLSTAFGAASNLKTLKVSSSGFGTVHPTRTEFLPIETIPSNLEKLWLKNVPISGHVGCRISQVLCSDCSLRELQLDSCEVSLEGMNAIVKSLCFNKTLELLSLDNIKIDLNVCLELSCALKKNRTLLCLVLNSCSLTDECLRCLVDAVATSISLKTLTISHNTGIANVSIVSAMHKLKVNESLEQLDLRGVIGYPMSQNQAQQVLDAFRSNYDIESLRVDILCKKTQDQIDIYARLNKAGRRYIKVDMCCLDAGVAVLAKVTNCLDDVFTHLLENPSLCERAIHKASP